MRNQILSQQSFAMDLETRIFKLVIQCLKIEFTGSVSKSQWPLTYLWPDLKFSQCISYMKISLHYIPGNNSYISEHDNDIVTFKWLLRVCVCMCECPHSSQRTTLRRQFSPFTWLLVITLSGLLSKHPCPLSHLTAPVWSCEQRNVCQVFPHCLPLILSFKNGISEL